MRTRIYFRENALLIEGNPIPFVAGSLYASLENGSVKIRRFDDDYAHASPAWADVAREDGTTFETPEAVMAYLGAELAKRRPVGDRVRAAVDIAARGQRVLGLQDPPQVLSSVRVIVNGIEYGSPDITVSPVSITWANQDFELDTSDRVVLVYT